MKSAVGKVLTTIAMIVVAGAVTLGSKVLISEAFGRPYAPFRNGPWSYVAALAFAGVAFAIYEWHRSRHRAERNRMRERLRRLEDEAGEGG